MHRDFESLGEQLLPDADRAQMERDVARIKGSAPNLVDKAAMVDEHWIPRLGGPLRADSLCSFRGLYTLLFRNQSGLVHATTRGLNNVTVDLSLHRKRVVLEAPAEIRRPYDLATLVYGLGLLVAAPALGWHIADDVNAVFEQYR